VFNLALNVQKTLNSDKFSFYSVNVLLLDPDPHSTIRTKMTAYPDMKHCRVLTRKTKNTEKYRLNLSIKKVSKSGGFNTRPYFQGSGS
jgi:hypothetical protein